MSGWSCRHYVNEVCQHVDGASCRPGMKGCIIMGKVSFEDGLVPAPVWPPDHPRSKKKADPAPDQG